MASARDRETALIDLALSVGAGLGRQAQHLSVEAVRDWRDYFSRTVDRAMTLREAVWEDGDNRKAAKVVATKLGRRTATLIRTARARRKPVDGALAKAARANIEDNRSCPGAGAGKWCDPS